MRLVTVIKKKFCFCFCHSAVVYVVVLIFKTLIQNHFIKKKKTCTVDQRHSKRSSRTFFFLLVMVTEGFKVSTTNLSSPGFSLVDDLQSVAPFSFISCIVYTLN